MKIKLKESRKPHVKNIIFHINNNKESNKNTQKNFFSTNSSNSIDKNSLVFTSFQPNYTNKKHCFLINHSGLIPKNPTFRSVGFNNERQTKPIKSM